ncbi:hypothetical protein [Haladaptatus sp. W1]|uniref:hypothetical protein n=1 Tax=Haladaptatus sp. W1 TaxID=1897478 RepID=UPI0020C7CB2F|nr:hypothetical protein [Haladaptatus sp. W1]
MSDFSPPSNSLLPSSSSRRRFLGVVSAAVAGTLGGCSAVYPAATTTVSNDDWPLVGCDSAGSGYKPDGLSLRSKPDVRWKRTPKNVFGTPSSPLVYDGTAYTATRDLLAVDVADGTARTLLSEFHGQFPAIAADTAYRNETVISTDGRRVSAVNPSPDLRGELRYRWRTPAPESSFASSFFPSSDGSPPVVADRVRGPRVARRRGTLHVGFQSLSAFRAQTDVYRRLARETTLDVHIYGRADWQPPRIRNTTYRAERRAKSVRCGSSSTTAAVTTGKNARWLPRSATRGDFSAFGPTPRRSTTSVPTSNGRTGEQRAVAAFGDGPRLPISDDGIQRPQHQSKTA